INRASGAGMLPKIHSTDLPVRLGCEVPVDPAHPDAFIADDVPEPKEQRKVDSFILFAIAAADEPVRDSGWVPETEEERCRTGVSIGSGIGGLPSIEANAIILHERGPRRIGPFFIPGALI